MLSRGKMLVNLCNLNKDQQIEQNIEGNNHINIDSEEINDIEIVDEDCIVIKLGDFSNCEQPGNHPHIASTTSGIVCIQDKVFHSGQTLEIMTEDMNLINTDAANGTMSFLDDKVDDKLVDSNQRLEIIYERVGEFAEEGVDLAEKNDCHINSDVGDKSPSLQPKQRGRKHQAEPSSWKKQLEMKKRSIGEAYIGRKVKNKQEVPVKKGARVLGPPCTCRVKSNECKLFTSSERQGIFNTFWKDMDWGQKKVYVATLVDLAPVSRRRGDTIESVSRRSCTLIYHLKLMTKPKRLRVCKKMFLNTLGIKEWTARNWAITAKAGSHQSKLNKQNPRIQRKNKDIQILNDFLNRLPKLPSHYCRAQSNKLYLETIFTSNAEVYNLYCTDCKTSSSNNIPLSITQFMKQFNNMNLALFKPKKDQCDICVMHLAGNLEEEQWIIHEDKKQEARKAMAEDTEKGKANPRHFVLTMDVQKVLLCPFLQASALYYKMKLAVHNFTVYNNVSHAADCFVWHEAEGSMSANEFASCIINYIEQLNEADEIDLWSDGCTYQNRNSILSNALLQFAVMKKKTIKQMFLEKGHTQMPCDTVHSTIERKLKNKAIYVPADYIDIIRQSRKNPEPYKIHYLTHNFFKNYSTLKFYSSIRPGKKTGDSVVTEIRGLMYKPDGQIYYKLRHSEDWQLLPQRHREVSPICPPPLYIERIKISEDKFKDLQQLKKVIPPDYHAFYDGLPH